LSNATVLKSALDEANATKVTNRVATIICVQPDNVFPRSIARTSNWVACILKRVAATWKVPITAHNIVTAASLMSQAMSLRPSEVKSPDPDQPLSQRQRPSTKHAPAASHSAVAGQSKLTSQLVGSTMELAFAINARPGCLSRFVLLLRPLPQKLNIRSILEIIVSFQLSLSNWPLLPVVKI
jgi:hypothetical protein